MSGFDFFIDEKTNVIVGRVCPPAVYLDKNLASNCLYYDGGNPEQRLDAMSGERLKQSLIDYLTSWTSILVRAPLWFHGNINVCSSKGMRLPTLFETSTAGDPPEGSPADRVSVSMAGERGVPPVTVGEDKTPMASWTSTGISTTLYNGAYYAVWGGDGVTMKKFSESAYARCVLPSNQ
jgi:hypothetical protein